MSRTFKDKPNQLRFEDYFKDMAYTPGGYYYLPTTKTKKKKHVNTEWHWYSSTPSWWTRLFMRKPARRKHRLQEHKILISEVEEFDFVDTKNKPHIYYY